MIVTTATNKKVRELLKAVRDGSLIPRPEFQRRLVWTAKDKDKFIESITKGYPFPEIYICNGEIDTVTGEGTQLLVDGLQRVNTLSEYFTGDTRLSYLLTKPYQDLSQEEKEQFLGYNVVVRDLGNLTRDQIIEVFRRLNSTQYTLRDMEVNNAVYDGAMKSFCEKFSEDPFFDEHRIFLAGDRKRMGDVSFCLSLVGTMMLGYFNRDSEHEHLLSRFNEAFPDEQDYQKRIRFTLDLIDEAGFHQRSRIWKKADFFSTFVEIDHAFTHGLMLSPSDLLERLENFFERVDREGDGTSGLVSLYYKSALQASNDRNNRIRRGFVIAGIVRGNSEDDIMMRLQGSSLLKL